MCTSTIISDCRVPSSGDTALYTLASWLPFSATSCPSSVSTQLSNCLCSVLTTCTIVQTLLQPLLPMAPTHISHRLEAFYSTNYYLVLPASLYGEFIRVQLLFLFQGLQYEAPHVLAFARHFPRAERLF